MKCTADITKINCKMCKSVLLSETGSKAGWDKIGKPVEQDKHSTSTYYQCGICGGIWEQLDEMDPGNHLHTLHRVTDGSDYQIGRWA